MERLENGTRIIYDGHNERFQGSKGNVLGYDEYQHNYTIVVRKGYILTHVSPDQIRSI